MISPRCTLVLVVLLGLASCTRSSAPIKGQQDLAVLTAMQRDCIQYPLVGQQDADGNQLWNADWVYFTLYDANQRIMIGPGNKPIRDLKFSELTAVMQQMNVSDDTQLAISTRLQRVVRHIKLDGTPVRDEPAKQVEDIDVLKLLATEKEANQRYNVERSQQ